MKENICRGVRWLGGVYSAVLEVRLDCGGWRVVGRGRREVTQTENKSDCLASDVSPLLSAKV